LPPGLRLYAIGDVHGCAGRLQALHGSIAEDLATRPVAAATLVHLGDYVDKGTDSAGTLDLLAAGGPAIPGLAVVNLMGNHEALMRDALAEGGAAAQDWLWCGGRATLASYGVAPEAGHLAWAAAVPAAHRALLQDGLALAHRAGPYLFVHAGIRPGLPLAAQAVEDLLGIRGPFLHSEDIHEAVVVHGHTARLEPELRHNRVNLDTGACIGGPLTCGVFEGDRLGFLTA
jgi:serine/threonine protein phosphatase 1